jgi:radical SAM/Cys-rich protein
MESFSNTLAKHNLTLTRQKTSHLQVNTGLLCNQACRHCHHDAHSNRSELMDQSTIEDIISYAQRGNFEIIDITGGAPELNPHLSYMIDKLSPLSSKIILRSNLTALNNQEIQSLIDLLKDQNITIVASLPSINETQADSQRGDKTFQKSIEMLQHLNSLGYGTTNSGLELSLVSNPTGAFLPQSQAQTENKFRDVLHRKYGIAFDQLFSFANVPLGRYLQWLTTSGNLEPYMEKLISCFNPCAVENVMCRTLVSVSWAGYMYDCDFNLACDLPMGETKHHVSQMPGPPEPGSPIVVSDHCYACTAGAGFT